VVLCVLFVSEHVDLVSSGVRRLRVAAGELPGRAVCAVCVLSGEAGEALMSLQGGISPGTIGGIN